MGRHGPDVRDMGGRRTDYLDMTVVGVIFILIKMCNLYILLE